MSSLGSFNGVAMITGAAGGIGSEVARTFYEAGSKLALVDISADALAKTIYDLGSQEDRVYYAGLDLCDEVAVEKFLAGVINKWGRLDFAMYIGAAILGKSGFKMDDHPHEDWEKVINTNVLAQVSLTRAQMNIMKNQEPLSSSLPNRENTTRGAIVNFSSRRGLHGHPTEVPYTTSKHAVIGFSRSAATGCAAQGVRINQVAPGLVDTPMAWKAHSDPETVKAMLAKSVPIQRCCRPQEIADLTLYLCSERASYIVGETIAIDGGMHAV